MLITSFPFNAESYIDRELRLKKLRQLNTYQKHKQTCLKNKQKRKNKKHKK